MTMMEDVLKACASYQSANTSPASVKLSSQAVGFLSVLVISGSIALIALGRQKLWPYVFEAPTNATSLFPSSDDKVLSPTAHRDVATQCLCLEVGALESEGEDNNLQILRCSMITPVVQMRKPSTLKKVRFAPDVVDPAGDGREYRRRMREAYRKRRQVESKERFKQDRATAQQSTKEGNLQDRPTLPLNRIVLYNGIIRQNRLHQSLQWS